MLARYARIETTTIIVVGAGLTAAAGLWLGWGWAVLPLLLATALLSFYRDPPRAIPAGADLLVAPADGKVTEVTLDAPAEAGGGRELRIVIFLSVMNAHVNRSPCAGRVKDVKYVPGKFMNALKPESTEQNERNTLLIEPQPPIPGPVLVRQIAGVLARRIVCAARPGDELKAGERIGMIKLGSRTELRAPADPRWRVQVRVGDNIKAGKTILARLDESQGSAPASTAHTVAPGASAAHTAVPPVAPERERSDASP